MALSLVIAQRRPGRRSQGSNGEHHTSSAPTEPACTSWTPTSRTISSKSGALEGRRFAPCDSIGRQHSGAVTHRRAARRAFSASFRCRWWFPVDAPALEFVLQFWRHSSWPFPKIEPPAHHICADRFSRLSRQCTPYVRACREPLPLPVSQSMRAIPECPNDAFQRLMSCAQATARRDAERARIRSAVTRTARA